MVKKTSLNILTLSNLILALIIFLLVIVFHFKWFIVLILIIPVAIAFSLFDSRIYLFPLFVYLATDFAIGYYTEIINSANAINILMPGVVLLLAGELVLFFKRRTASLAGKISESEQKFKTLLNYTYDWEYYINQKGKVEYSSPSCEKITQYTAEEFMENPNLLLDIVAEEDREKLEEHYKLELENKHPKPIQFKIIKKNSKEFRVIRHTCNPVYNENGKFIGVRVTNRNSTDRWKAEQGLKATAEKYKYVFENLVDVYYQTSIDGEILMISPSVGNISGFTPEQLIGKNASMLYKNKEDRDKFLKEITQRGKLNNYEVPFIDDKGRERILSFNNKLIFDENGKPVRIEGIFRDVTEKVKIEKALEEERNKYKALFDTNLGGVYLTDLDGNILEANLATANIFGFDSVEELKKYKAQDLFFDKNVRSELIYKLKKNQSLLGVEYNLKTKDGKQIWVIENCKLIDDNKMLGTLFDITEFKTAFRKLKISEQKLIESNHSKDRFFSIIAHDVRSPFASLLGLSQMLHDEWDEMREEEKKQAVVHLKNVSERIFQLLEGLLQWARIQTDRIEYEPQYLNVKDSVNSLVIMYSQKIKNKSISVDVDIDEDLEVFADENMFNTVIRNLLSNSLKFTPINGKVRIFGERNEKAIKLCVEDNGVGMDAETRNKLFKIDEKVTNKGTEGETGTGLGLILCSELVKKMGGKIWVESEIGKGSKFFFTIPKQ